MSYPSNAIFPAIPAARIFFCMFLALAFTGCGTTCIVGVINPPNGGIVVSNGNLPAVCSQNQTPAAVKVSAYMASPCMNCGPTQQISRLSLMLSGVELHPGAIADENSPEWQELASDLARLPQRFDLVADSGTHQFLLPISVSGHIPAGQYSQIRLRLAETSSLESADGRSHSLQTRGGNSYVIVQLTAPFIVSPGQVNGLQIALHSEWGLARTSAGIIEVVPELRGEVAVNTSARAAN